MKSTFRQLAFVAGTTLAVGIALAQSPRNATPPQPPPDENGQAVRNSTVPPVNDPNSGSLGNQNAPDPPDAMTDRSTDIAHTQLAKRNRATGRTAFATLDANHDGTLSTEELGSTGLTFAVCDTNGDGRVSQDEYAHCNR